MNDCRTNINRNRVLETVFEVKALYQLLTKCWTWPLCGLNDHALPVLKLPLVHKILLYCLCLSVKNFLLQRLASWISQDSSDFLLQDHGRSSRTSRIPTSNFRNAGNLPENPRMKSSILTEFLGCFPKYSSISQNFPRFFKINRESTGLLPNVLNLQKFI